MATLKSSDSSDPISTTIQPITTIVGEQPQKEGELEEKNAPIPKKSFKFKLSIFMICLMSVIVAMDSVIVAATLPAITVSLRATSLEAFWVGTSYLLAQTVVIPLYGSVSDIFGRKWVMVFAIAMFLFGSILCGAAQNIHWLIAARVLQGLGGGGCLTLATVIISDMTILRERPKFLALGAFAWALGTNIGVPVGGAIGQLRFLALDFLDQSSCVRGCVCRHNLRFTPTRRPRVIPV